MAISASPLPPPHTPPQIPRAPHPSFPTVQNWFLHSGQVDWPLLLNHLYRHVEWNMCLHVKQRCVGSSQLEPWMIE